MEACNGSHGFMFNYFHYLCGRFLSALVQSISGLSNSKTHSVTFLSLATITNIMNQQ